jgi:hypothetical protein
MVRDLLLNYTGFRLTSLEQLPVLSLIIALAAAEGEIVLNRTTVPGTLPATILLFNVGVQGIMAGIMHWYGPTADRIARKPGWPAVISLSLSIF